MTIPTHEDLLTLLDPISDAGCNSHLVGMLYQTIATTIIPQLAIDDEPIILNDDDNNDSDHDTHDVHDTPDNHDEHNHVHDTNDEARRQEQ